MSKSYLKTLRLVTLAILSAIGAILMLMEFPYVGPFKIDPSDSTVVVAAVIYGPFGAALVGGIKGIVHLFVKGTEDFGIGELIAFTASLAYSLPFYYAMKFIRKVTTNPLKVRIIPAIVGTISLSIVLPLLNLLVFFQLWSYVVYNSFMKYSDVLAFSIATIPGNIVKGLIISAIFLFLSFRLYHIADVLNNKETADQLIIE